MAHRSYREKNKINVYYNILKDRQDENVRAYYISNFIGEPFMTFELGQNNELEILTVATHLGIKVEQMNIIKRGKKNN